MDDLIYRLQGLAEYRHADVSVAQEAVERINALRAERDNAYQAGVRAGWDKAVARMRTELGLRLSRAFHLDGLTAKEKE